MPEGNKIAIMQWPTGLIFIGEYLGQAGDELVLNRVVSLQQMEDNSVSLVAQPLCAPLISGDLDNCRQFINGRNLAIYGLYPIDSDHEVIKMFNEFWRDEV